MRISVSLTTSVCGKPYEKFFSEQVQPSANPQGAIVAAMPAGSFFGSLAVSELADKIGRKKTIILSGIIWVIGSILQAAAQV